MSFLFFMGYSLVFLSTLPLGTNLFEHREINEEIAALA